MSSSFCKYLSRSLSSPDDKLSENIWFVWFKTSHDGDKWRCYHGDDERTTKSENRASQQIDQGLLTFAICSSRADKRQACVYDISTIALDKATSDKENQLIDMNLNMEGGEGGLINAESIVGLYCILA